LSTSKPSREITVVDVPDVPYFDGKFIYNYHVVDEGTNATAGVEQKFLEKSGEFFDSKVIDYLNTARAPRYVVFEWTPVTYRDRLYGKSNFYDDVQIPKNYIRDNLSKVLSEEHFASEKFSSINISDQSIDQKFYNHISSSATLLNSKRQEAMSQRGMALKTDQITSNQVDYQFLSKYLVQPAEDGVFFYEKNSQRIKNELVNKLKDYNIKVQFNNSIIHTLMKRAVSFPETTFNNVYLSMYEVSKKIQGAAASRGLRELSADDYRTVAPEYLELSSVNTSDTSLSTRARIIGYIIDRHEVRSNGNVIALEPIVIENVSANRTVDLQVKYYSKYHYAIRTVAEFTIPSIVEETGDLVVAKFLIASKPSKPVIIDCVELVPPPPPADTRYTWNYEDGKLFLSWAFPPNSQRDIKQFQIFRRKNVNEPFQLVRHFFFDDSMIPAPYNESPDPRLVDTDMTPKLCWIDDEFTKESNYIYAFGSVDAHGMVSGYSAQTKVTFNRYKNRLILERISPEGAPRPYPNVFLRAEIFKDSVVESKKYTMHVAFEPEHIKITDKDNNDLGFLKTDSDGSKYKILVCNTDLAVAQSVDINVKDMRSNRKIKESTKDFNIPDYGAKIAKNSQ
jgi:hypothetical protein